MWLAERRLLAVNSVTYPPSSPQHVDEVSSSGCPELRHVSNPNVSVLEAQGSISELKDGNEEDITGEQVIRHAHVSFLAPATDTMLLSGSGLNKYTSATSEGAEVDSGVDDLRMQHGQKLVPGCPASSELSLLPVGVLYELLSRAGVAWECYRVYAELKRR